MMNEEHLNFTEKRATPCSDRALKLAEAFFDVQETREQLADAKANVPSYTAQFSPEDYYQDEQQAYYDACAALEALVFTEK